MDESFKESTFNPENLYRRPRRRSRDRRQDWRFHRDPPESSQWRDRSAWDCRHRLEV